jgi:hypothetical protein
MIAQAAQPQDDPAGKTRATNEVVREKSRKIEDNDMLDPLGQSVQQAVQSILAPDMKELKGAVSALETRIDRLESLLSQQFEEHFQGIMKAIGAP